MGKVLDNIYKIKCTRCGAFIGYSKEDARDSAVCLKCYYGKESEAKA